MRVGVAAQAGRLELAKRTQSRTSATHNQDHSDGNSRSPADKQAGRTSPGIRQEMTRPTAKKREPLLTLNEVAEIEQR
jgi:hypothetical protein